VDDNEALDPEDVRERLVTLIRATPRQMIENVSESLFAILEHRPHEMMETYMREAEAMATQPAPRRNRMDLDDTDEVGRFSDTFVNSMMRRR